MAKENPLFTNKEISEILRSIAAAYLLSGENRFRIIAYEKAADTVEHMNRELHDIWEEGKLAGLQKVTGIGPTISGHLDEYFEKGKSSHFDKVLAPFPPTIFILMRVPGLGAKKAFKLVKNLELTNPRTVIDDLKKACEQGKVATMESFGEKSEKDILESLTRFETSSTAPKRMPMPYAMALADEVMEYMKKIPGIKRTDAMGSLRRRVATIGDIDIAVATDRDNIKEIIAHFIKFPRAIAVDNAGDKKASIIVSPNIRIDLRVQEMKSYGSMLQYFTGSKAHNIKLREFALRKNMSLNEWGIKDVKTGELKEFDSEEKFYGHIGLPYIPPEMREGSNEIQLAVKKSLPHLVEKKDMKGDLHIHSSYDLSPSHDSGANSYEEIAQKAKDLGYEYVGFTDHNPSMSKNTPKDVVNIMRKRKEHIDELRKKRKFAVPVFIGLETDILPNGEIALPEDAIEYVDYLIVSIHSSFRQDIDTMTARVLKGLSYPKVKIFGHPTGRLLGHRDGIDLNWQKVFAFVKEKDIALEINCGPERLDLPDSLVRDAKEMGICFTVDTDAHHIDWMDGMEFGISVARRGWAEKSDIMNTMSLKEFEKWLKG